MNLSEGDVKALLKMYVKKLKTTIESACVGDSREILCASLVSSEKNNLESPRQD